MKKQHEDMEDYFRQLTKFHQKLINCINEKGLDALPADTELANVSLSLAMIMVRKYKLACLSTDLIKEAVDIANMHYDLMLK